VATFTIPPDNKVAGQSGFVTDINNDYAALSAVAGFNVLNTAYGGGADSTGVTDSSAAIQAAVNAAGTAPVIVPAGTYLLASPVTIQLPLSILGAGRDSTVFTLGSGVNDFAFKFTAGLGTAVTGARFADFQVNGNASAQTAGGGILANGAVECHFERLHLTNCFNWGIELGPVSGGAFGHNNRLYGCTFDNAAAYGIGGGLYTTSCDENMITACDFQYLGGTTGPGGAGGTIPIALYDASGLNTIQSCVFVNARASSTQIIGVRVQNTKQTRIENCVFDGIGGDNVFIASTDCTVLGCEMTSIGDGGPANVAAAGVHLEFGNARCIVANNNMSTSTTGGKTGYFIYEQQIGNSGGNVISGNTLWNQSGTAPSTAVISTNGTASIVRSNIGYNPVGSMTPPALAGSGTALLNPFNVDSFVIVSGGTVTAIALGGTATGLTTGQVLVPAAQTITLTYTGTPAWKWFGS
jgi:Pectate lyase superfamily protein/Right handed beta helix region